MVNGTTFGSFMPNYGMISWGYPMMSYPQTFNGSAFGFGFPSSGTSSADSYGTTLERMRKQEEAEYQKRLREAEAREAQEAQEKLMEEMKKEASDAFPELNADEEKILLAYLEKVNKSYNKQVTQDGMETAVGITGTAAALGALSWFGEHSGATAALSKGATWAANITPTCVSNACTSVGNGVSWVAQHTGATSLNTAINSAGYGRVATAASEMTAKAATTAASESSSMLAKAATSVGAKTTNFCNGALQKVAKLGPVVEAGKVVYEDWGDLKTAYKAGGKSAVKQTAQTAVKAGAAAVGFWAGAKGGAALGATIGSFLGPVGTAVGGFLGGLIGGIVGSWGAKKLAQKCVGKDEGERLKHLEMEKAAAEKQAKIESYQNDMLMEALTYAQTDEEIDEETAMVLAKLQGRFGAPPEQAPAEQQAA